MEAGSPASRTSIHPGDIVTRVQGERVARAAEYDRRVRGLSAGETLRLSVMPAPTAGSRPASGGNEVEVDMVIASLPGEVIDKFAWDSIGVEVETRRGAVTVTDVRPGSTAAEIGFAPGDAIAAVGGREVDSLDSFRKELGAARSSASVLVSVVRGRRLYRVVVPLGQAPKAPARAPRSR